MKEKKRKGEVDRGHFEEDWRALEMVVRIRSCFIYEILKNEEKLMSMYILKVWQRAVHLYLSFSLLKKITVVKQ